MKLNCEQILELLPHAAEGELDESLRAEVLKHARYCPECGEALDFQTRLHKAVVEAPQAAPPPVYFEGVLAEIHRRLPQNVPAPARTHRWRPQPQTVATGLMAALVLLWVGAGLAPLLGQLRQVPTPSSTPGVTTFAMSRQVALAHVNQSGHPGRTFVVVKGYGLLAADSELWRMTPEQRRELGLPEQLELETDAILQRSKG